MACGCRATITLWYRHTARVLQWMDVDGIGKQSGVARHGSCIYVKEQLNWMEFYLQSGEPVESLWVKIREQINRGDIVVGVCYRPLSRKKRMRPSDNCKMLHVYRC